MPTARPTFGAVPSAAYVAASGMDGAWLFNEPSGNTYNDLVGSNHGTGLSGGTQTRNATTGLELGSNGGIDLAPPAAGSRTFVARLRRDWNGDQLIRSTVASIVSTGYAGSSGTEWSASNAFGGSPDVNKFRVDQKDGHAVDAWLNGTLQASPNPYSTAVANGVSAWSAIRLTNHVPGNAVMSFGMFPNNANAWGLLGAIAYVYTFARLLTDAELVALYADDYLPFASTGSLLLRRRRGSA